MDNIIAKLGTNYVISTFIPTLGFVLIATTIFEPIIPESITRRVPLNADLLSGNAVFILTLTVILGFVLSGLMIFIYKITEGYYVLARFPYLRKRHQSEALKLKRQIAVLQHLLSAAKAQKLPAEKISSIRDRIYYLQSVYEQKYPQKIEAILPTRFGNILRAAELHANTRYGIDAVPMWPRLVHVIPESHYKRIQESNNNLAFLVNCMVLSILLAVMCLAVSGYQYGTWRYAEIEYHKIEVMIPEEVIDPTQASSGGSAMRTELLYFVTVDLSPRMQSIYHQRSWLYLFGSLIFAVGGIFFYFASLTTVFQYGEMIRSSYDLFRLDLLRQFRLPLPQDLRNERERWQILSELIAIGHAKGRPPINFAYDHFGQDVGEDAR